jgi:hypothetical protein
MALQIGKTETEHSTQVCKQSNAGDDSQDAEQWARRHFRRNGRGGSARDI